jgi:hypothetical protein
MLTARLADDNQHEPADVTFTRNAKGETQVSVSGKTSPTGVRWLEQLEAAVAQTYDHARMRYPMEDGSTAKPGSVS